MTTPYLSVDVQTATCRLRAILPAMLLLGWVLAEEQKIGVKDRSEYLPI